MGAEIAKMFERIPDPGAGENSYYAVWTTAAAKRPGGNPPAWVTGIRFAIPVAPAPVVVRFAIAMTQRGRTVGVNANISDSVVAL